MASQYHTILIGLDHWHIAITNDNGTRVVEVALAPDAPPAQAAQRLAQSLREQGHTGEGVGLAIPSNTCLCAAISTSGLPRKNARQAMVYRLEEKLPLAAEEIVADFADGNGHALGVCVQTTKLLPLIHALEEQGVPIELVCPTTVLALQHKLEMLNGQKCDVVVWGDGERLEFFLLADGKPKAWHVLADGRADDLQLQLGMAALTVAHPLHVATSSIAMSTRDLIDSCPDAQLVNQDDEPLIQAAAQGAHQILTGKQVAWVNLRRDAMAVAEPLRRVRKPIAAVVTAAIVWLACLNAVMLWRAAGYDRIARDHESQQAVLYGQLFPDRTVPVHIKSRLASEQRRLLGLGGGDARLSAPVPVLNLLRDALANLPQDVRYRIHELRLDENGLYIEGQARSHSGAEAIAASLNDHRGFSVESPRTEKLPQQGVAFTITGKTVIQDWPKEVVR